MKNEPWIDRVYKDNLQTREIKLDFSHWQQAEKMIGEQEKKKKKKRILFWMLLAGVAGMLSIGSLQFWETKAAGGFPIDSPPSEKLLPTPDSDLDTTLSPSSPYANLIDNRDVMNRMETKVSSKSTMDQIFFSNGTQNGNKKERLSDNITNNLKKDKLTLQQIRADKSPNKIEKQWMVHESEKIALQLESGVAQKDASPSLTAHSRFDIASLEKKHPVLTYGNRQIRLNDRQFDDLNPIKIKPLHWAEKGIRTTLAQEANTGNNGTAIAQAGLELYYHRSINKSMFYGMSVGYLSNFNKVQYAQILTEYKYQGFGAQVNNYGIKPNWMQYGFIQLSAGVMSKKHRLMIGARPELLIATKGNLDQIEFSDPAQTKTLSNAQISIVNQGWLQNNFMNKISMSAYIGYDFKIMERVGLGIQLNHILKSPFKPLDSGIVQSRQANWNTGFRLSYLLK